MLNCILSLWFMGLTKFDWMYCTCHTCPVSFNIQNLGLSPKVWNQIGRNPNHLQATTFITCKNFKHEVMGLTKSTQIKWTCWYTCNELQQFKLLMYDQLGWASIPPTSNNIHTTWRSHAWFQLICYTELWPMARAKSMQDWYNSMYMTYTSICGEFWHSNLGLLFAKAWKPTN